MLHGTTNLGDYISNFDWDALRDIDVTAFGATTGNIPGLREGDTITVSGFYDAQPESIPFHAYGLNDHKGLKRGAPMSIAVDDGPTVHGVVTGRYKQRDGTVHAWGVITP